MPTFFDHRQLLHRPVRDLDHGTLETALQAIDAYGPEVLIVSFGADTFAEDPFSEFQLKTEDYLQVSNLIASLDRPRLVVMEGGYAVEALGQNVATFLSRFLRRASECSCVD